MSAAVELRPAHGTRHEVRSRGASFVATKTITVRNEVGKDEELKAGVTFIHDARHFLVTEYPHLFAREGSTGSRAKVTPPRRTKPATRPNTFSTERPRVVLLDGSEPTVMVRLCRSARDVIRDQAFRARDGDEIGGALYAVPNTSKRPAELEVERACGPGPKSRRAPAEFRSDISYYVANENRANGEHQRSVCWIGDWHCHPISQQGLPSPADLLGWARALQAYGPERGLSTYVGLIVTAPYRAEWGHDARQDWNSPRLHAWVLSNAFERWVCTPGRIEGWRQRLRLKHPC
jgi:hypothetical protein